MLNVTTIDKTKELIRLLDEVKSLEVYVGIPEEKSSRKGEQITNAELCYIHTNGSPLNHIPERAIIEPAIELKENKDRIVEELKLAAESIFNKNPDACQKHLAKAGLIGQNATRAWFTDPRNNWPPNSIATAKAKLSKMNAKDLGKLIGLKKATLSEVAEQIDITDKNISRPLIDTAELRKSIIYVVAIRKSIVPVKTILWSDIIK